MPRPLQHGDHREGDREPDAREDPEHEHADERGDGEREVAAVDAQEPPHRRHVDQPQHRGDHDRGERRRRDVLQQARADDEDEADRGGRDDARQLGAGSRRLGDRACATSCSRSGSPGTARSRGWRPRAHRARGSGRRGLRASTRSCARGRSCPRTRGARSRAAASASRPRSSTDGDGIVSEGRPPGTAPTTETSRSRTRDEDRRARRRRRGSPAPPARPASRRGRPRGSRSRARPWSASISPRCRAKSPTSSTNRSSGRRHAEEARQLVGDHDQRDPGEVPEPDGLREQIGEEAEPGDGPDEQQRADHEREQPCDGDTLGRIGAGDGDHGGRDERRERRVGAENENPRRPEHGVGEERNQGRVEAGDGRKARQLRVRHPLGHEQRREHDTGDEVAPQPLPPVGARNPDPGDERPRSTPRAVGVGLRPHVPLASIARARRPGSRSPRADAYDARASATSSSRSRIAA